jgi:hypothetical protein
LTVIDPVVVGGAVTIVIFFGVLVALRLGRLLGGRAITRFGSIGSTIGSLEAAVFALLGLLIAFSFSGALTRFDARRAQVVQEANAIGTAWLRIDVLPAAAQPKLRETFKAYVDARIAIYRKLPDMKAALGEVARSMASQDEIWTQAVEAVQLPKARPDAGWLFMPALNEMFDISTTRFAATEMHPPVIIYAMLVALALVAALLAGYQSAGEKGYAWIHKIAFATIVSATVYVILEIEYPRLGLVRLDAIDHLLVDVRARMK